MAPRSVTLLIGLCVGFWLSHAALAQSKQTGGKKSEGKSSTAKATASKMSPSSFRPPFIQLTENCIKRPEDCARLINVAKKRQSSPRRALKIMGLACRQGVYAGCEEFGRILQMLGRRKEARQHFDKMCLRFNKQCLRSAWQEKILGELQPFARQWAHAWASRTCPGGDWQLCPEGNTIKLSEADRTWMADVKAKYSGFLPAHKKWQPKIRALRIENEGRPTDFSEQALAASFENPFAAGNFDDKRMEVGITYCDYRFTRMASRQFAGAVCKLGAVQLYVVGTAKFHRQFARTHLPRAYATEKRYVVTVVGSEGTNLVVVPD